VATSKKKDKKEVKPKASTLAKSASTHEKYKEKLVVSATFEQLMKELITPKQK